MQNPSQIIFPKIPFGILAEVFYFYAFCNLLSKDLTNEG